MNFLAAGPKSELVAMLSGLVENDGPDVGDYAALAALFDRQHQRQFVSHDGLSLLVKTAPELDSFRDLNRHLFQTTASLQGFAHARPHGYSGDFEMIEKIYLRTVSTLGHVEKWDRFFQTGSAPNAVRNRSRVLRQLVEERSPSTMLSVGSGSALDALGAFPDAEKGAEITLLDNDQAALARARMNFSTYRTSANLKDAICGNALRFRSETAFDLIWSAGLFDYLSDRASVALLSRLRGMLAQGGVLAMGNFGPDNPSRSYMEIVGRWFLRHRSPADLLRLGSESGFRNSGLNVGWDDTGVNLILTAEA